MNELVKRAFFGLIYVLVVVFSLQTYGGTVVLLGLFMILGLKEFSALVHLNFKTALLPALFLYLTSFLYHHSSNIEVKTQKIALGFTLLVLFIPFIYFILGKLNQTVLSNLYLSIFYLAIPFALALGMPGQLLLAIFIIIWASDSFAYLVGKYLGKHKLAEKISPKKTIEGFIGGLAGSLVTGYIIYVYTNWFQMLNLGQFFILIFIIVIFGTLGDLLESRFKRLANVKDSGQIIPGHGGILDRLDSFIFALPFVYIFLLII